MHISKRIMISAWDSRGDLQPVTTKNNTLKTVAYTKHW